MRLNSDTRLTVPIPSQARLGSRLTKRTRSHRSIISAVLAITHNSQNFNRLRSDTRRDPACRLIGFSPLLNRRRVMRNHSSQYPQTTCLPFALNPFQDKQSLPGLSPSQACSSPVVLFPAYQATASLSKIGITGFL